MYRKLFATLLLTLAFALPVGAQDETPEAVTDAPVIESIETATAPTVPDGAIVVNDGGTLNIDTTPEETPTPAPAPDTVTVPNWLFQNYIILLPLLYIAASLVQNAQHNSSLKKAFEQMDKTSKDAVEAAYEALPPAAETAVQHALDIADRLLDEVGGALAWARQVTDGRPNTEPGQLASTPAPSATFPLADDELAALLKSNNALPPLDPNAVG